MQNLIGEQPHRHASWKTCVTLGTIDRLFLKFSARYGSRWTAQLDDEALLRMTKHEWYEGLKHLKNADIKRGLDAWDGDFPPNLMEFKKACRRAPYHKPYSRKALPPPINRERGLKAIKQIREILA